MQNDENQKLKENIMGLNQDKSFSQIIINQMKDEIKGKEIEIEQA